MIELLHGDCLEWLKELPDCSVDACVTDPPYGLSFMGKAWDYDVPQVDVWREVLRVLKPGGHLLAFAGTRTQHRMAVAIEDAGFEIRDMIAWVYGSGFPKSLDVSKAIDKAAGAEREVVGQRVYGDGHVQNSTKLSPPIGTFERTQDKRLETAPAPPAAQQWSGWGTALKPALEPITVARKPLGGRTVAANVLEHGTGAINVDGCRVAMDPADFARLSAGVEAIRKRGGVMDNSWKNSSDLSGANPANSLGRWPANLIHDGSDEVVGLFPDTGISKGKAQFKTHSTYEWSRSHADATAEPQHGIEIGYGDSGSAARFFYCAKASKADRGDGNGHPTVKPTELMRYLCRLVTPPGGVVLDPFMGSGSTGKAAALEGFRFIGIEREAEYLEIARRRVQVGDVQGSLL
jgi:site-specific DNA-methyltransferase (adenine-specific)